MEIRPLLPADLSDLAEIDGTVESSEYLHLERTAEGLSVVLGPGARANRVTATEPVAGPAWSADGRLIAIVTRSRGGGPDVLDVLAPGSGSGPAFLQTSTVFERISGPLVWNPAG